MTETELIEPKKPSLLRNRNFQWLWGGQTVSVIGSQMSGLALPVLAITMLGVGEAEMGLINAADTSAFLVFGLMAGAWIDRWVKKRVMMIADFVRAAALVFVPVLWLAGVLQFWHILVIGAIVSVATVFFDVSYQSVIPILFSKDEIGVANSRLETTNQISHIVGPGFVGFLLTVIKAPWLIFLDAISFVASAGSLWRIKTDEVAKPLEERRPLRVEIAEGVNFVWNQKLIRAISFCTATSNLFGTMIATLLPLFILRDIKASPAEYGVIMGIASIGGLLGASATSWLIKKIGEGPLIAASAVLMGITQLCEPIAVYLDKWPALILMGALQFLASFSVLTYNITQVTARQRLCPPHLLGRMNASIRFFVWGVMPIGALLGGWLGASIGMVPTLWIAGFFAFFAAGFVVFSPISRMREMPSLPENQVEPKAN